jgi:hypothetical protein
MTEAMLVEVDVWALCPGPILNQRMFVCLCSVQLLPCLAADSQPAPQIANIIGPGPQQSFANNIKGSNVKATMARRVLVQLPMSHYNERARWALDYAQVQYEKVSVMPFLHMPVVLYYQKKACQFAHILSRTRH